MASAEASSQQNKPRPVHQGKNIPADKINLRLIMVSSRTAEFLFPLNTTASEITEYVYQNWPEKWAEEPKPDRNILRLIYQGRFLHGSVNLSALALPTGKTTVMHLVSRENLPEPNSHGHMKKNKLVRTSNCCSSCCCVS